MAILHATKGMGVDINMMGVDKAISRINTMVTRMKVTRDAWLLAAVKTIQDMARAKAPEVSGNLRDSIHYKVLVSSDLALGFVGPDHGRAPYDRRIEFGFHGADSLGRTYDQQGHPYFQPAVLEAQPILAELWLKMTAGVIK